jgi:hypothetical protein
MLENTVNNALTNAESLETVQTNMRLLDVMSAFRQKIGGSISDQLRSNIDEMTKLRDTLANNISNVHEALVKFQFFEVRNSFALCF